VEAFTPEELALLRRLVGRMIPASREYDVPGADDPAIFAEIAETLASASLPLRAMLATLDAAGTASASPGVIDGKIHTLFVTHEAVMGQTVTVVAQCYYRDDRVMRSLNMEPRAPFPQGFEIEQGDWSLLDPVRARPKLWRDAP